MELKLSKIGNSRGVRIPAQILKRYHMEKTVILEVAPEALILRAKRSRKLSWKETWAEMAKERESWRDWEGAVADGLDYL